MFKKVVSFIICFVVCFCCVLPTFAQSLELEAELINLALSVKNTLDISDDFSNFTSSVNDYKVYKTWTLNWLNKNDYVNVTTTKTGKILNYNYSYDNTYVYKNNSDFSPKFTKDEYIASKNAAIAFLNKVLDDNESVHLVDRLNNYSTYLPNRFHFSGTIKINNLNTPFSFSISVNASDSKVISFSRTYFDGMYINNDIPTSEPRFDKDYAKSCLSTIHSFGLEYQLDSNSQGKTAKLYYLPVNQHDYYVDALTGELVNKDSLYPAKQVLPVDNVSNGIAKNAKDEMSRELTLVELENIAKLRNVLDKEKIDALLKSKVELGLSDYTLTSLHYSTNKDNDDVYCSVTYIGYNDFNALGITKNYLDELDYDLIITKNIYLNAKTGELESLYTSYPYIDDKTSLTSTFNDSNYHIDFLNKYCKDLYNMTKLYNSNLTRFSKSFTFAQNVNNYFFPTNCLNININLRTGFVDSFYKSWYYDVVFEDSDNIITEDTARTLFYDSCNTNLSYIDVPTKITKNKEYYDSMGYSYLNKLCLAYTLENPTNVYRIHAKTGKLDGNLPTSLNVFEYSDIDNCMAKERILLLAQHGIGFEHNKFDAHKNLTQLDALVLLANSVRYSFDVSNLSLDAFNSLYSIAYRYNFINPSQKEPLSNVSRSQFVKMIISASIYKNVANLKGIFKCDFNDADTILDEYMGYVCVARSLGIILGDENLNFNPNDIATRLDACNILYNFMQQQI